MRINTLLTALLAICVAVSPFQAPSARAQNLPDLGEASQDTLSPQMERRIGESIMQEERRNPNFLDDPESTEYLNNIGLRLVSNSPEARQDFEFFLVKDKTLNAFALPGGFIGVHTGLIVAAQSESELASVLAHEITHVTQHHMARMVSKSGQVSGVMLAAMILGILSRNSQVGSAAAALGQAGAVTAQIGFTRDFEREADRGGFQLLEKSGFDVRAMPAFFERLQKAGRLYENNAPAYLLTHPVTTERIADAQNRIQGLAYKQVPDSLDFQLVRAKLRADQGTPREAVVLLEEQLREKKYSNETAAHYGLAEALLRAKEPARAEAELAPLMKASPHPMFDMLSARIRQSRGDDKGAAEGLKQALFRNPNNRALSYEYVEALQRLGRNQEAVDLLEEQIKTYPNDQKLYVMESKSYAAMGKRLLQHQAQAEAYIAQGSLPAAIEQLQIAQKSGDGDFYQQSSVDARLRELRGILQEQMKQSKK